MSPSTTKSARQPTFWERTLGYSNTAYTRTLKPGFDKAYAVVDKLGAPVNRLSNRVGSEAFWPTTLDKESTKCARILRSFCKDGFYEHMQEEAGEKATEQHKDITINVPQGKQTNLVRIPAKVIQNAVGLAIFTTMRTGWMLGGSGGAGIVVARNPDTREWSSPSGIMTHNVSVGFLMGVDIYDTILVINNYTALEAFTRLRCTLGAEVGVVAGPVGVGSTLDTEFYHKPAPVWSYVKGRGLYAGVALAGNVVIERSDENERFYGYRVSASDILAGRVRNPPVKEYQVLVDTLKAAQGDVVDDKLLPLGEAPSDMELDLSRGSFGVPAEDDDDPYGVKALEAEGLHIREAGTHRRPSAETFEFKPAPSSPVYPNYRRSVDSGRRRTGSWRNSATSVNSTHVVTPNAEDEYTKSSLRWSSKPGSIRDASPENIDEATRKISTAPGSTNNDTSPRASRAESIGVYHDQLEASPDQHQECVSEHEDIDDDLSELDSDVEIGTAVTSVAGVKVVNVPKREAPALPARNPGRVVSATQTSYFTIKLQTHHNYPQGGLVLRSSIDDWTVDHTGEHDHSTWQFKLDTNLLKGGFECKFVLLPDNWMHGPNIHIENLTAGDDITFSDDTVAFDLPIPSESTTVPTLLADDENKKPPSLAGTDDEDKFVSVPPTPDVEKEQSNTS